MNGGVFHTIEKLEADLWEAADQLRANSKLTSSDYFMPVLGIIFLRHAANRYEAAAREIAADQAAGRMAKRRPGDADYIRRRALPLPESAHYDSIMAQATSREKDLPSLVTDAMKAIEEKFEPLKNVLPKDYGIFEADVLEDLMRLFNSEQIKQATGDVFGRIYEYFLAEFSKQKAHDNGEFFTPPSLVQLIVNVIEPDHGKVFDPACGSGGMFVQSSHFIEHEGGDTARKVVFYGQEKNPDTIRIAKMNLAVHGLTGEIAEAITYYQDEHSLAGKCDFVMANPPFNVDLVDALRIKLDPRLPFGMPGVSKGSGKNGNGRKRKDTVSNGNYLWISYFWSYLNETGRAGFVMSSQASSAGHGERDVRDKIVRTGDVDVMISIRNNFFYTRTVPCELWFFDRGKTRERRGHVLMLDARGVFRKLNRTLNDFSPEQMANLSAIVWLYRGQRDRFLALVHCYLTTVRVESAVVPAALKTFEATLADVRGPIEEFVQALKRAKDVDKAAKSPVIQAATELDDAAAAYLKDRNSLVAELSKFARTGTSTPPATIKPLHAARESFDPMAERIKGLIKQIDLLYKLADRAHTQIGKLASSLGDDVPDDLDYDRRGAAKLFKLLDDNRQSAVEQLRQAIYFHKQAAWLLDRFPDAKLADVPGLVKVTSLAEIKAADWTLTPGRYVGVAPAEVDDHFDFEQAMRDIHAELGDLNEEAVALAATIQKNLEEIA